VKPRPKNPAIDSSSIITSSKQAGSSSNSSRRRSISEKETSENEVEAEIKESLTFHSPLANPVQQCPPHGIRRHIVHINLALVLTVNLQSLKKTKKIQAGESKMTFFDINVPSQVSSRTAPDNGEWCKSCSSFHLSLQGWENGGIMAEEGKSGPVPRFLW